MMMMARGAFAQLRLAHQLLWYLSLSEVTMVIHNFVTWKEHLNPAASAGSIWQGLRTLLFPFAFGDG